MFIFNSALAYICLIPLPFMFVWGIIMGSKMREGFRMVRKKIAEINSTVENSVQGILLNNISFKYDKSTDWVLKNI